MRLLNVLLRSISSLRLLHAREPGGDVTPYSITAEQWGSFLCAIFDEWVRGDVGRVFVQLFDATLANWVGASVGVCTMSKYCGQAAAIEYNGDVYACDHFVFPEYKLGNIHESSLLSLMYGHKQREFGESKSRSPPQQCRKCRYEFACHGECPRNRFITSFDGEPHLYNLTEDLHEDNDIAADHPDIVRQMVEIAHSQHTESQYFKVTMPPLE